MKLSFIYILLIPVFLFACSGREALDADFRIDPLKDPEPALRSLFFKGDSISFYEDGRPPVDTSKLRRYGIKWVKKDLRDTLKVSYNLMTTITIDKDSITPPAARITALYLSFPNNQAFWRFGPEKGAKEIKTINILVPNSIRTGTFPVRVGATLEGLARDTGTVLKPYKVTVPEKNIFIRVE